MLLKAYSPLSCHHQRRKPLPHSPQLLLLEKERDTLLTGFLHLPLNYTPILIQTPFYNPILPNPAWLGLDEIILHFPFEFSSEAKHRQRCSQLSSGSDGSSPPPPRRPWMRAGKPGFCHSTSQKTQQ